MEVLGSSNGVALAVDKKEEKKKKVDAEQALLEQMEDDKLEEVLGTSNGVALAIDGNEEIPGLQNLQNSNSLNQAQNLFSEINGTEIGDSLIQTGNNMSGLPGSYTSSMGQYYKQLGGIVKKLMSAIQRGDANGVKKALSSAIQAAQAFKTGRENASRGNYGKGEAAKVGEIYGNVLNDPNMVDPSNPMHALNFFNQTVMWAGAGSMPQQLSGMSASVGGNNTYMDPVQNFGEWANPQRQNA